MNRFYRIAASSIGACVFAVAALAADAPANVIEAPRFGAWGFDMAGMDRTVKPGDDFAAYVNGTWERTTPIPEDRARYGSFDMLRELSQARVRRLLEAYPHADPRRGGDAAKLSALYRSYLDEAAVEAAGTRRLDARLAALRAVSRKDEMARVMGEASGGFGNSFFAPFVADDSKNPQSNTVYLAQSGLGLGDREMYLDARFAAQKARYAQYIGQMLELAHWPEPQAAAERVLALETQLAQAHWTRADSRNRDKTYNPATLAQLQEQAPSFPWAVYVKAAGIAGAERYIVRQNTAFPQLARVFEGAPLETLKAWQAFHVTDDAAPLLPTRFVDAHFDFHSRFLNGQPQQRARWKRAVEFADGAMGEAIGRDYVALYYPPTSRAIMDRMVADLRAALKMRIEHLAWMSPQTQAEALDKLRNFRVKVGYPEKWRDYSALEVREGDLLGNAERARRFEWDWRRGRIALPVDPAEWSMTPQTVNAYYNLVKNEIVFPAAILQPPFFDPQADPAVNYGAIGSVIGHEISHGFDDQGRKSDGRGLLRDWWTPQDAARFEAEATKLGAQYESYDFPTLPGMHVNGRASMGENIGDLAGVSIAFDAYRNLLGGRKAPVLDGFTGEQRFFLAYGQLWRTVIRDDALRQQLATDPHSPGHIRAFGPLRNVDAWYDAFGIKPGDKLYLAPDARAHLW